MEWYIQLPIYLVGLIMSFSAMWNLDYNKILRRGKNQNSLIVYFVLSLALGYLIGKLLITIGELISHR